VPKWLEVTETLLCSKRKIIAHFCLTSSTVAVSFSIAACSKDIICKVRSSMSDSSSTDERSKRMPSCMNNSSRNFTSSTLNFSLNCININFITNSNYKGILQQYSHLGQNSSAWLVVKQRSSTRTCVTFFFTVIQARRRLYMFRPAISILK